MSLLESNTEALERLMEEVNNLPNPNPNGASVQSDWNQTDETAADFIKNKPFYDGRVETVIIEEAEYAPDPDMGFVVFSENAVPLNLGQVYTVYFDSMIFQCVPVVEDGGIILGDMNLVAYPFAMLSFEGVGTLGMFEDGLSHNVRVIAKVGDVEKIDASLISTEWSATTLKNEDIIIPLANRDFSNGKVEIPYKQNFSFFEVLPNDPTTIKVIWNGVEHSDKSFVVVTGTSNGVVQDYQIYINDDVRFYIGRNNIIIVTADCESATFSFSIVNRTPRKMPTEYLPNIPSEKIVLTSPGGKRFNITVDDSGVLTATEVTV